MKNKQATILSQAKWVLILAEKIEYAARSIDPEDYQSRERGTVKNLCPELAKASAKLSQMMKG